VSFTAAHRGGSGPPLVLLHGFMETWRTWELVLPRLEREHEVLALTLPGHAGGPALGDAATPEGVVDHVERMLDDAGVGLAHLAGNSLGGWLALALAARGRARSVVAFAPAGGWAADDRSWAALLEEQERMPELARAALVHADTVLATPQGRRGALAAIAEHGDRVPPALAAEVLRGVAACPSAAQLTAAARAGGWPLAPARIACPVRVVWGTADRLLPWPAAAARYRNWLAHADWVELEDVGHAPQLDVPLEAAQLILGLTAGRA